MKTPVIPVVFHIMYGKEAGSARIFVGFKNYGRDGKNITDCGIWAMEVSGVYGASFMSNVHPFACRILNEYS